MLIEPDIHSDSMEQRSPDRWSSEAERDDIRELGRAIHNEVARRVDKYLEDGNSGNDRVTVDAGDPLVVGHSVLFRYQAAARDSRRPLRFFAKVRREWKGGPFRPIDVSEDTVARTVNEFRLLQNAHSFFSARGSVLSVARPLDYLDEFNAAVIQEAAGGPLDRQVVRDARGFAATQLN